MPLTYASSSPLFWTTFFGDFTKAFARNGRLYYEQTENATDKKGKESN